MDESSHSVTLPDHFSDKGTTINFNDASIITSPNPTINNNKMTIVVAPSSTSHQQNPLPSWPMNPSCYNLIVLDEEFLRSDCVTIPNELVFNESIRPQLKERFCSLDDSVQAELRSFPCIFATPNRHGNQTDADHQAHFGIIKDIKKKKHAVMIRYSLPFAIQQQRLNEIVSDLHIRHTDLSNEFDTQHWTVKEANLLSILLQNNLLPF